MVTAAVSRTGGLLGALVAIAFTVGAAWIVVTQVLSAERWLAAVVTFALVAAWLVVLAVQVGVRSRRLSTPYW